MKMQGVGSKFLKVTVGLSIPLILFVALRLCLYFLDVYWIAESQALTFFVSEVGILLFMSVALSLNLRCERFDFSLGAVAILSPLLALGIFSGAGIYAAVLTAAFFGGLLGLISGGVQMLTRLPPAFCSLGLCIIYEGLGYICSRAGERKYYFFGERDGVVRFFIISVILLLVFLRFLMRKTLFGYNYRAISQDENICRRAGMGVELNKLFTYILSGALMGIVGIMIYMREGESMGASLNFSSVRVLFFGLLPLFVGRLLSRYLGEFAGDFFGAVSGAMIYSAMLAAGFSEDIGIVISAALLLLLLIYLSRGRRFFDRIHTKHRT